MRERRVSAGPVLDAAGRLAGVVAEADLLLKEAGAEGLGQLRIAAGHRPGTQTNQDCQSVRIYASELYPRQDSNLRSRLRRPLLSPLSYGGSRTQQGYQPWRLPRFPPATVVIW
jgi:hypothetical protein